MADKHTTVWLPNNNYFPGRNGYTPRYIILHGTAGFTSAEEVARFFKSTEEGDNPVSTHYIIGRDGAIVQCVHEQDGAWGNGAVSGISGTAGDGIHHDFWWSRHINPNLLTISIEHVKPSHDNTDEITEEQKKVSFYLVEQICQRYNIPKKLADEHGGITGHYSMDPVHRSFCPGPYPWHELIAYLNRDDTDEVD